MMMGVRSDLGPGWVARREMEIRSRHPPRYDGFAYEGLLTPLLLLSFVVPLFSLVAKDGSVDASLMVVAMFPYATYLALAAAGMVAGSLVVDRDCARRLPVSPWSLLVGKLVGSLLPLWGEVLFLVPLLVVLAWTGMVHPTDGLHLPGLVVVLAGAVLLGGLFGAASVQASAPPRTEAYRVRTRMWLYLVGLPVLACLAAQPWFPPTGTLPTPAVLVVGAFHPFSALVLLAMTPDLPDLALTAATVGVMAVALFGVALWKVRTFLQ